MYKHTKQKKKHSHRYTQLHFYKCERFSLAATLFNQSNLWSERKKHRNIYRQNTNKKLQSKERKKKKL